MDYPISTIMSRFDVPGAFAAYSQIPNGHINDTFVVVMEDHLQKHHYLLQRMNHHVFKNVQGLMENICSVTRYLHHVLVSQGKDPRKHAMTFVSTKTQAPFYFEPSTQTYWRLSHYIEGVAFNRVEKKEDFYQCGLAFGQFQRMLDQYDASTLFETIPYFHHTPKRYEALLTAIQKDVADRVRYVEKEIAFLHEKKAYASLIVSALESKEIPVRVTHNDTKLNNVIFNETTREAVAVVDLDTIMPGSLLYDFGDAIRYGANTASEDEIDLNKVDIDLDLFQAFSEGFLHELGAFIYQKEIALLALSPIVLTYELAVRFLTDYLQGDTYFKVKSPTHNLERTRVQIALIQAMEKKLNQMQAIIKNALE